MAAPHAMMKLIRKPQFLVVILAAVPFAASLGFHAVDHPAQAPAPGAERPALVFDQYLVNLGQVESSARAEAVYRFLNAGKSPVHIVKLEPSCGCLSPKLKKRDYQPGEAGEFTMGVATTREKPGPNEYTLTIDYTDPKPRSITLGFKLVIRKEVTVVPSQLVFYQNGRTESKRTVLVTDMRNNPLRIMSANSSSPRVKVLVGEPVDNGDQGRQTTVTITVASEVAPAGEDATVSLVTDDPTYPRIPVWLMLRDIRTVGAARKPVPASPPKK